MVKIDSDALGTVAQSHLMSLRIRGAAGNTAGQAETLEQAEAEELDGAQTLRSGSMMADNFVSQEREQSRYVKATMTAFSVTEQMQNSAMGIVNAAGAIDTTGMSKYAAGVLIGLESEKLLEREKSRHVSEESEEDLEETTEEIERAAEEAATSGTEQDTESVTTVAESEGGSRSGSEEESEQPGVDLLV